MGTLPVAFVMRQKEPNVHQWMKGGTRCGAAALRNSTQENPQEVLTWILRVTPIWSLLSNLAF